MSNDSELLKYLKPTRIKSAQHSFASRFFYSTVLTSETDYTLVARVQFQTNVQIEALRLAYAYSLPETGADTRVGVVVAQNTPGTFSPSDNAASIDQNIRPGVIFWEEFATVSDNLPLRGSKTVPHYFYPYHYFPQGATLDIYILKTDFGDVRGNLFIDYVVVNKSQHFEVER